MRGDLTPRPLLKKIDTFAYCMKEERVILVDPNDQPLGTMEKMEAHQKGLLHRAFSVFIVNSKGELLLQQRALHKYHSPGLWTNTCCSHQRKGETTLAAASRRLEEEMGMQTPLTFLFSFIYNAAFDNGLTEHELDHVLFGIANTAPQINPEEVAAWKWMKLDELDHDLQKNELVYTVWFRIIFKRFYKHYKTHQNKRP